MEERYWYTFSITREEFVSLLLLLGELQVTGKVPITTEQKHITMHGIRNHNKFGTPGVEDGANHNFETLVEHDSRLIFARVSLNSQDQGQTYQGSIAYNYDPTDWISEH